MTPPLKSETIRVVAARHEAWDAAHDRKRMAILAGVRSCFGDSFYRDAGVLELIGEKLPVSLSLGLWSTLIIYLVAIPLGIRKAVRDGSRFDWATSLVVVVAYAIPI